MKKLFSLVLVVVSIVILCQDSFGTAHLKVVKLVNYPDTAISGPVYGNILIRVTNIGNTPFGGDIHVYLYSQALGIDFYDTLRDDPSHPFVNINPSDTVSLQANPFYRFSPAHYAAGDNIIVVWPAAITLNSIDSLQQQVNFTDATDINVASKPSLTVYPNPVSKTLNINYEDKNAVERVRIYDLFGREVFAVNEAVQSVDLSGFKGGIYILEMNEKNGNRIIKKILITGE